MNNIPNELTVNFNDIECRRKLIELYGDKNTAYSGVNDQGEKVYIAISKHGIQTRTNQSNGWIRVNYYDKNGHCDGESYDGRWRSMAQEG